MVSFLERASAATKAASKRRLMRAIYTTRKTQLVEGGWEQRDHLLHVLSCTLSMPRVSIDPFPKLARALCHTGVSIDPADR